MRLVMRLWRLLEGMKSKSRSLVAALLRMTNVVGKPKRKRNHAVGRNVGQQVGQKMSRVQRGAAKRKSRRGVEVPVRVEVKTEKQRTQRRKAAPSDSAKLRGSQAGKGQEQVPRRPSRPRSAPPLDSARGRRDDNRKYRSTARG